MTTSRLNLYTLSSSSSNRVIHPPISIPRTVRVFARTDFHLRVQFPSTPRRIRCRCFKFPRWGFSEPTCEETVVGQRDDLVNNFQNPFEFLLSILPGGNWWSLSDYKEKSSAANEVTVRTAIKLMWEYLGKEQWIVVVALGALIIAAVAEIIMPTVLAASIFSAQHGDKTLFYSKAHFLLVLCFTSGVSSGLRSGLFATANVILVNPTAVRNDVISILNEVKRLRQALYSALVFQDMVFFDREEVGGLTSRLGADCQQLSNVLGNNIHLIVRNTLQGLGALINLLMLSWPLALSSIITCSALAAIFLLYGRYQKVAAKLTQDLTASASEAAEETLSSIRTIRVYGTENEELGRYKHWLERLSSLSLRESVAYGCWNTSFSILFRSTQVFALLLGGMSIRTGHVSTEDLTKQEPKLFHMDVKSNITYGCGEDITEEEVEQAAKLAHAHDFILALPDGYRTMVDSNLLSGGQKQRIAIARAIIRKPPILVLDEATSALDSQTEHFVKEITEAFISGEIWKTTIIVITHRLSSVKTADRIIVIDGGRIVEMGGHKELLQENGLYSRLVKLQSSSIT